MLLEADLILIAKLWWPTILHKKLGNTQTSSKATVIMMEKEQKCDNNTYQSKDKKNNIL